MGKSLLVSPSPHLHANVSTTSLMRDVIIALVPASIVSVLFYGWAALLVFALSIVSCVLVEWVITKYLMKKPSTVGDLSAVVTGLLLAMNLPATTPWWIILIGAIVAIGVAKMSFGGLGQNIFNPAITARVFLLISFPSYMTNWTATQGFISRPDAVSGATPLGVIKEAIGSGSTIPEYLAANNLTSVTFLQDMGASLGELSSIALLLGFVYLLVRKVVKAWIPVSIFATVILISGIFSLINPDIYTGPVFNIFTGGMVLGACFMATDYVTSPMSTLGGIIYGVGIGVIVMMIRYFGSYPEGMSFAILIMNCVVPLLNIWFHQKKYGRK
ncbi:MAG: RnfABCDGE type electron transport complex subunit D [Bacteroidales bacterium]|nr:RnfABCDGE type electron transport complex subunit D [Bacteroidales bacterium]MBQ2006343.1 RnfABCDGE type electron transport complex subunit D [Bacteroidales bacterium]MBQ5581976.1 RnfABCDGE type electron transport complex subunit D [Bacteroidales bacterium]